MAVSNSLWVLVLMTAMTSCVVYAAPTGVLEEPLIKEEEVIGPDTKITEAVEEVKHLDDLDEDIEKALLKEESLETIDSAPTPDDKPEAPKEEKEIVQDEVDEVINGSMEEDTDDVIDSDVMDGEAPLGSSESDLLDYLMMEPSMDYYSFEESAVSPWLYDLPNEPSYNQDESQMWSSNFDIFDEYLESYYGSSAVDDVVDNGIDLDTPGGAFDGIPVEEMNNQVDQTVDEFLCQLGLCADGNVQYQDEEQLEPNEIQFTEEGMMGNENDEVQDEKDIYTIETQPEDQTKEDTNTSVSDVKGEDIQSSSKLDVASMPEAGTRHRSKRDLSWDDPGQGQSDLIEKINALERLQEQDDEATQMDQDQVLTPQERFEDLIKYFKNEADENTGMEGEEFYVGAPLPNYYNEAVAEAEADEIEEVGGEEGDENEIEEGEFLEDDEMLDGEDDEDSEEEGWGAFLVPGSPYREGTLTYDGYKRDDEKESLKVYVESLPNLEGYRKRSDPSEYLDIDPRSSDFRRQIDPRSPPDEIRYPKTGLEPFSREKYFPVFSASDAMADEAILDPDWTVGVERNDALVKYNELLGLLNTELEAAVLISSIEDMAAELGRNQLLLDELERKEEEDELQLALDKNNQDILGFMNAENSRQVKRTPRVIDYQDFNEYPPVFQRSFSPTGRGLESLSDDELLSLYNEYLQEADEEDNWGDFVEQPRTRRDGEDALLGPHVGYYVQGRMIGDLMKPKRNEEDGYQNPYILLQPSDLGYEQWPGDFDVYYDTRDGSFIMDQEPIEAMPVSEDALLDALGMSGNIVEDNEGEEEEEEDGRWGDFKDNIDDFQDDLEEIDFDIGQLEELRRLTEFAEALNEEDKKFEEEELLRALLLN
ncbi:uncharacterized protein LOC117296932 [Asterias rubens]|uniref:uncharacterized protein LOC117296932 n=1 Tax=Asterias rubens TaxID=7604 RepID=UPI001455BB84|nr:uncharacterized protein LOC117296932 [Asterias rubens]